MSVSPAVSPVTSQAPEPVADTAEVRRRLRDASLYLCTDARREQGDLEGFLHAVLDGGVDIVQLRDKGLDAREELALLSRMGRIVAEHGALLAVNDRADLAALAGADVLHTGQADLPVASSRGLLGPRPGLGRSTHSLTQALEADADPDVDYFCVGPVWATPTKPGRAAVGLELVRAVAESDPHTPWFAIGGVDGATVPEVLAAGARRIVVVRAVTRAADPGRAARELAERLRQARD